MIIKSHLRNDYEKKYIVHNFYFYINKKIHIQKTYKMKKKTKYKTNIFLLRECKVTFFILKENA